jgi:hypothetical protein
MLRRFKFTLKDNYYFNYKILIDVIYISSKSVLYNVVHKRAAHPSERRTLSTKTLAQRQHIMPQQRQTQRLYTEADVQLTILDL